MGGLTPQVAILLAVERINFNNDVAVIIGDHFRLSVMRFCATLIQLEVAAIFTLLRRLNRNVRVSHHVVCSHASHALGIIDLTVGVGVELGSRLNDFVGPSINESPIEFLRGCER